MSTMPLPEFVRRPIEQAIERAVNPTGMSVHDGKIHGLASDKVSYLLRSFDSARAHAAELQARLDAAPDGLVYAVAVNDKRKVSMLFDTNEQANAFVAKIARMSGYGPKITLDGYTDAAIATSTDIGKPSVAPQGVNRP
jgi:hypothetical protein